MTEHEFTQVLTELLQESEPLDINTELKTLKSWDSLAWMLLMAFAEKENLQRVKFSQLRTVSTVQELYSLLMGAS